MAITKVPKIMTDGLENVDNTSDANKPVSTATQNALDLKVDETAGTLTNGSIVTPSRLDSKQDTFANLQTYAATASNGQLVFATDLKQTYQIIDGTLKAVGGAGGINYISNSDFESGTTGYATYADAAGLAPVNGTGGTANTTFTATAVSPLRGTKSGLITKSVAISSPFRQGEGVSYNFTIDAADQAQILRISFDYSTSTNYADGNIRVYVYDVTNNRLIEVVDRDLLASAQGKFVGTFQTSPDSLSYRLIFHIADSLNLDYTVEIDNVVVGPQTIVKGAIVTDWESDDSIITFSNVTGVLTSFKKRIGDTLSIKGTLTLSSAPAGVMQLVLASGYSLDFTKINSNIPMGTISFRKNSVPSETYLGFFSPIAASNSFNILTSRDTVNTGTSYVSVNAAVTTTVPFTWASGDLIRFEISDIPIQGWSSNVVLSEDAGNREIAFLAYSTAAQSISTNNSAQKLLFADEQYDTSSSYSSSTFTAPESGRYQFDIAITFGPTNVLASAYQLWLYKNGSLNTRVDFVTPVASTGVCLRGSPIIELLKGDTVEIYIQGSGNNSVNQVAVSTNSNVRFSGYKLSSPQTIAASEVVAAKYINNNAQNFPPTVATIINFNQKVYDTHNAVTTGASWRFTAPQSGYYKITASALFDTVTTAWASGQRYQVDATVKNSSGVAKENNTINYNRIQATTFTSFIGPSQGSSTVFYLDKSDYIEISISHNRTGATPDVSLIVSTNLNYVVIQKVNGVS